MNVGEELLIGDFRAGQRKTVAEQTFPEATLKATLKAITVTGS